MTLHNYDSMGEVWWWDDATGRAGIASRADHPPADAPLEALDDHLLGARRMTPDKPWVDLYANVQQHASPGNVHAVVIEAACPYPVVASSLLANAEKSLERPINFLGKQVCVGGGLPTCSKTNTVFHWDPQHEFRGLRHLMAWRRFGWPSERFLAECAISRVVHEPTIYDEPHNQREIGWPLLLLVESLSTALGQKPDVIGAITKIIDALWPGHDNYYCLLTKDQQKSSNHLAVVVWQHAILTKAFGRLVRRGWPDPRAAVLYKAGLRGLDATRDLDRFTWAMDWDPETGQTKPAESPYNGTTLWTAAAYAESLGVVDSMAGERRAFLKGFMKNSAALNPKSASNWSPQTAALLTALV